MKITIAADHLYGISLRPQELAMYGETAHFSLRYAPVFDDPEEIAERHYSVLVVEVTIDIADGDALGRPAGVLQLLKCGWELERHVTPPQQVGTLPEAVGDVARLLQRIADTVNDLAKRAGLDAPMGHEVVTTLLHHYRSGT